MQHLIYDLTITGTATATPFRLRLHFAAARAVGVSWIDVVPFWWLGISGLGSGLAANRRVSVFAKAVEIGGQLAAQRLKSGDRKLGVLFVGLSGVSKLLVC